MKKLKYIFIICTIVCIVFIWYHSSLDGYESSIESQSVLSIIKSIFSFVGIPSNISEFVLRKLAHFLEFSGLGFLLTFDIFLWSKKPLGNIIYSPAIGLCIACVDETIQIFSPGRTSRITDVWIDFAGIISATIVTYILCKTIFKNIISKAVSD